MTVKNTFFSAAYRLCLLGVLGLSALSCRSMATDLYDVEHPATYQGARPQNCVLAQTDPQPVQRSYAAMLRTLDERKWNIQEALVTFEYLRAQACLGISSTSPGNCVAMIFSFKPNGDVTAHTAPETPVIRKMDGHVERWMNNVDKIYNSRRCMPDNEVQEVLAAHGLVAPAAFLPLPTPQTGVTPETAIPPAETPAPGAQ